MKRSFLMLGISLLVAGGFLSLDSEARAPQVAEHRRRIKSSSAMCSGN